VTPRTRAGTDDRAGEVSSALRGLLRPPRRARLALLVAAAVLATALCWYIGMDTVHAVTFGLVVGAAGLLWTAVPEHRDVGWEPTARATPEGARWDVTQLSWSLRTRRGRVQHTALRRVQELARHRLALRRLDLDEPGDRAEIERLIGEAAYATLARPGSDLPRLRALVHCLDVLDGLDPPRPGTAPSPPPEQRSTALGTSLLSLPRISLPRISLPRRKTPHDR
jgi:hypothetical protein